MAFDLKKFVSGSVKTLVDSGVPKDDVATAFKNEFHELWNNRMAPHLKLLDPMVLQIADAAIDHHLDAMLSS